MLGSNLPAAAPASGCRPRFRWQPKTAPTIVPYLQPATTLPTSVRSRSALQATSQLDVAAGCSSTLALTGGTLPPCPPLARARHLISAIQLSHSTVRRPARPVCSYTPLDTPGLRRHTSTASLTPRQICGTASRSSRTLNLAFRRHRPHYYLLLPPYVDMTTAAPPALLLSRA